MKFDVLIVGAGHGGAQAAIALRQGGFTGSIGLVGDEPEPPYERPPLSKDYLAGDKPFERMLIRPASFWADRDVALLPGRRVVAIDAEAHRVMTETGETIGYGTLIWATGGTPRRLACPCADLAGVHAIRTRADVDRLTAALDNAERIAVVGAGYIGLEAAAVLAGRGKQVTVLEAQDRVLARVAGAPLSRFYEAEHRDRGVDLRLGIAIDRLAGDERVTSVHLVGGQVIAADLVIVGIGIEPAVAPLLAAGADGGDGVRIDGQCRTSLPDIFAIGDCALHANAFAGGAEIRLESVQNANDMATVAARTILGEATWYDAVPWFWSNQYDLKLQTVGLSLGHDETIVRGDPDTRRFSVVYLKQGRVIALDCVNAVKDYVQGRRLVVDGIAPDRAALADPARPIKELG